MRTLTKYEISNPAMPGNKMVDARHVINALFFPFPP
jgi:hypothetical protein